MNPISSTNFDVTKLKFTPLHGSMKNKCMSLTYEINGRLLPLKIRFRRSVSFGIQKSKDYGYLQLPFQVHPDDVSVVRQIQNACKDFIITNKPGNNCKNNILWSRSNSARYTWFCRVEGKNNQTTCVFLDEIRRRYISHPEKYTKKNGYTIEVQPVIHLKYIWYSGISHPITNRMIEAKMWIQEEVNTYEGYGTGSDSEEEETSNPPSVENLSNSVRDNLTIVTPENLSNSVRDNLAIVTPEQKEQKRATISIVPTVSYEHEQKVQKKTVFSIDPHDRKETKEEKKSPVIAAPVSQDKKQSPVACPGDIE